MLRLARYALLVLTQAPFASLTSSTLLSESPSCGTICHSCQFQAQNHHSSYRDIVPGIASSSNRQSSAFRKDIKEEHGHVITHGFLPLCSNGLAECIGPLHSLYTYTVSVVMSASQSVSTLSTVTIDIEAINPALMIDFQALFDHFRRC